MSIIAFCIHFSIIACCPYLTCSSVCNYSLHSGLFLSVLTLILLMWRIWWAPKNASKWQMGFNLVSEGLNIIHVLDLVSVCLIPKIYISITPDMFCILLCFYLWIYGTLNKIYIISYHSKSQSSPSRLHKIAQSTKNFHLNKDFNITCCCSYFNNCKYTQADNTYSFSIMQ